MQGDPGSARTPDPARAFSRASLKWSAGRGAATVGSAGVSGLIALVRRGIVWVTAGSGICVALQQAYHRRAVAARWSGINRRRLVRPHRRPPRPTGG